jgi:hypothetical protein
MTSRAYRAQQNHILASAGGAPARVRSGAAGETVKNGALWRNDSVKVTEYLCASKLLFFSLFYLGQRGRIRLSPYPYPDART